MTGWQLVYFVVTLAIVVPAIQWLRWEVRVAGIEATRRRKRRGVCWRCGHHDERRKRYCPRCGSQGQRP